MSWVYTAECHVDAPVERVWAVLVDLERYSEWNPFTPRVRGPLVVGQPVHLTARMSGWFGIAVPMAEELRVLEPPRRLVWGDRIALGLIRAERVQTLEPVDGGARYRTVDTIEGPLAPLVHLLFGSSLQSGFEDMARALSERLREQP